jgi:hypothetical protein
VGHIATFGSISKLSQKKKKKKSLLRSAPEFSSFGNRRQSPDALAKVFLSLTLSSRCTLLPDGGWWLGYVHRLAFDSFLTS